MSWEADLRARMIGWQVDAAAAADTRSRLRLEFDAQVPAHEGRAAALRRHDEHRVPQCKCPPAKRFRPLDEAVVPDWRGLDSRARPRRQRACPPSPLGPDALSDLVPQASAPRAIPGGEPGRRLRRDAAAARLSRQSSSGSSSGSKSPQADT